MVKATIGMLCVLLTAAAANAAFIVEPNGLASGNYSFTGDGTAASGPSLAGAAIGLTGAGSIYGGNGDTYDEYTFSYTPGTDADNFFPTLGEDLGHGDSATGVAGGGSGTYYVYITWPSSTNVNAAGSLITVNGDGAPVIVNPVDNNSTAPLPNGTDKWLKLGKVPLTAGNTYTVTQRANVASFVSQRNAGVMWEPVPEPATMSLLGLAGLAFLRRRR